jgi:hypothetical protein
VWQWFGSHNALLLSDGYACSLCLNYQFTCPALLECTSNKWCFNLCSVCDWLYCFVLNSCVWKVLSFCIWHWVFTIPILVFPSPLFYLSKFLCQFGFHLILVSWLVLFLWCLNQNSICVSDLSLQFVLYWCGNNLSLERCGHYYINFSCILLHFYFSVWIQFILCMFHCILTMSIFLITSLCSFFVSTWILSNND